MKSPPRVFRCFWVFSALFFANPVAAQVIWSSNYGSTWGLTAWDTIQCGAASINYCPASVKWSPSGSGGWQTNGLEVASTLPTCVAGTSCRFALFSQSPDGFSGPFVRVETHAGSEGDQMWSGDRNELQWNAECDPNSGVCDNLNGQDRYYAWKTYFPSSFPAIPSSGPNWHVLFQFHEVGGCSGHGPPLTLGLKNYQSSTPYSQYKFVLTAKSAYGCADDLPIWEDSVPLKLGMTHSFVLHAHFSTGNSGYYQLWIDGAQKADPRMLNRPTLYTWPWQELSGCAPAGCDAQWYPSVAGKAMSLGVKSGDYHTTNVSQVEVLFHSDVTAGHSCADIASPPPPGCGPAACTPTSCAAQQVSCGAISDGCGGTLNCGLCPSSGGGDAPFWVRQAGTAADEYAYAAAADASGNVYAAGYTYGSLDYPNSGGRDAFLRKYDPNGNELWGRQLGNWGDEWAYAVAADANGNAIIAGSTTDALYSRYYGGADDAFVAKFDRNGNRLWIQVLGTSGDDVAYGVATDRWGNVFVVGSTTGSMSYSNQGGNDAFIAKLDPYGAVLWIRQLGTWGEEFASGVSVDASGSAYAVGSTTGNLGPGNRGGVDAFVVKYSTGGDRQWVVQLGSAGNDAATAVALDGYANVFVAGDTTGNLAFSNQGGKDGFVAKYDTNANPLWVRQLGSAGDDRPMAAATDAAGDVFLTGYNTAPLYSHYAGGADAFLAKFTSGGDQAWIHHLGTGADEVGKGVAASGSGLYVVGGTTGALSGANAGGKDLFIAKFGQ